MHAMLSPRHDQSIALQVPIHRGIRLCVMPIGLENLWLSLLPVSELPKYQILNSGIVTNLIRVVLDPILKRAVLGDRPHGEQNRYLQANAQARN